jgi:putative oxidoreductase
MSATRVTPLDFGLLLLRLGAAGLLFFGHGWPKLATFAAKSATFPDPLGMGPAMSLGLVVFAEVACSVLVAIGLFTRLAVAPILIFFAVAVFVQHAHDPWSKKEFVLIYSLPFLALLLAGPGSLSVDAAMERSRTRRTMSMERR